MIGEREALLHAKLGRYRRMVSDAEQIIRDGLKQCSNPFVSCSFGKDSAVMLHLVMRQKPDVSVRFIRWPETNLLDNFDEVINAWRDMGARIDILDLTRKSLDEKVKGRWDALSNMSAADGYFIGMRKDESAGRRIILSRQGAVHKLKNGMVRICPLMRWSTADVAAYVVTNNLPTLSKYKKYGFDERTSSRIPRDAWSIREKTLSQLRDDNPDAWRKLREIYPEIEQWQ